LLGREDVLRLAKARGSQSVTGGEEALLLYSLRRLQLPVIPERFHDRLEESFIVEGHLSREPAVDVDL